MNREKTRRVLWYQFNDSEAIVAYLEKMARRGWLLEKIRTFLTFRRTEPENLTFAVTYFPDASVFDPAPTEGQKTYIDYCRAVGWELAAVNGPMQIFYSRLKNPTPIETDERLKLTAIRKTMRKTVVLSYALLLVSMLWSLHTYLESFSRSPLSVVSRSSSLGLLLFIPMMALVLIYFLLDHGIWCLRSQRSVERGGACLRPSTGPHLIATGLILAMSALMILAFGADYLQPAMRSEVLWAVGGTSVLFVLLFLAISLLKKHGRSRGVVLWGYIGIALVVTLIFIGLSMKLALSGVAERTPELVYTDIHGQDWDLYRDALPVTLETLGYSVTEADHCSYEAESQQSPLASSHSYLQLAYGSHSTLPGLSYTVTVIRWDRLREICWKEMAVLPARNSHSDLSLLSECEATDPAPWGAEAAYHKDWGNSYLLLYDDRIITISTDWDLTEKQVDLMREMVIEK